MSPCHDPIGKPVLGQWSTPQKLITSLSCKLEPTIWSCDTGQQIPCFDMCQLIIVWMSNTKEVCGKPRMHVSFFEVWPPCWATPSSSLCVRTHEPTSNTASHDNHVKINWWVSFSFLYMSMGLHLAAWSRESSAYIESAWGEGDHGTTLFWQLKWDGDARGTKHPSTWDMSITIVLCKKLPPQLRGKFSFFSCYHKRAQG